MNLTIIISTFNRSESLASCLLSLSKQTDKQFKVLIVDGNSTDNTSKVITRFSKKLSLRVIVDSAPHLSYIRDLGWRESKSDLVAWIDDDVVMNRNWVKSVKQTFKNSDIAGLSGPTVIPNCLLSKRDVFYFHTTKSTMGKLLSKVYFNLFMQGEKYGIGKIYPSGAWSPGSNFAVSLKLSKPIEVDYLEACNFVVRRSVLEEVDGFNLDYIGTSEWCEVDLCFRIRKLGYRLFFYPKALVEHRVSSDRVFLRRKDVVHRLQNFFRFYLFSYYPKSIKGWGLFLLYSQYLFVYYLYVLLYSF